jgi:hypothetical protein
MASKLTVAEILKKLKQQQPTAREYLDQKKVERRERDMRQDAIDQGAHGAAEFFGGQP